MRQLQAALQALQEQLDHQSLIAQSEKATADDLLASVQRLEEQLQEAEREKVQAQASTLSAEVNAEEIARLHSLLSGTPLRPFCSRRQRCLLVSLISPNSR